MTNNRSANAHRDILAQWVITLGGLSAIGGMLVLFLFLAWAALSSFGGAGSVSGWGTEFPILLFGSLKGAFYGLSLSFPLAILAAVYVSHMMKPRWRNLIKGIFELMATVPTVIVGFLGALWLAPALLANPLAVVMALVTIPLLAGAGLFILFRKKSGLDGLELFWVLPLLVAGVYLAHVLGLWIQDTWFGGAVHLWLAETMGIQFQTLNGVVVAFALGFAVIPVVFTICEDALSSVPKSMSQAVLAMGGTHWQAIRDVVLPLARPGLLAAALIGFGRAVGETMIILMVTGNTPTLSPSPLTGMRSLAADIALAFQQPSPDGSSQGIFLSAFLLLIMSLLIHSLAETVRLGFGAKYRILHHRVSTP